jgi:hypothetical protein
MVTRENLSAKGMKDNELIVVNGALFYPALGGGD